MSSITIYNNGQKEEYILDRYAKLGDIGIMQKINGSAILCSVCIDYDNPVNEDFIPLNVQYVERMYAIGKIPQGFIKREGKQSENEILTSRLIDRSLRPLFPKNFPYPVQITLVVMSYDNKSDLSKDALNLAGISLSLSSIPIKHITLNAVRLCKKENIEISNNLEDLKNSTLDLFVSGTSEGITMVEMQTLKGATESANEISKENLLQALLLAKENIAKTSNIYSQAFASYNKEKIRLDNLLGINNDIKDKIKNTYFSEIKDSIFNAKKNDRKTQFNLLKDKVSKEQDLESNLASKYLGMVKKEIMRDSILNHKLRTDGRSPTDIREIQIESNILPHVHGSSCFTRGETQALVTCTLGSDNDVQAQEGIAIRNKKKVMFHYNFPPFCLGEAYPIGASSRRELGHGNLALKAIESSMPNTNHVVRFVSEILQSNGSSSMASVCGATLAALGAGLKVNYVAGIAMGLIYEDQDNYVILSDITGAEDYNGDMDFKITGNENGFTALQLDIKIDSLSQDILDKSFTQAYNGLMHVLSLMKNVEIKPNYDLLPQSERFSVLSTQIADIIGQGGRTIRDIISRFGVSIDIDKDNSIIGITANNRNSLIEARDFIFELLRKKEKKELPYKVGGKYSGIVKKALDFGIFVEMEEGGEGLIRSTRLSTQIEIGKKVKVLVLSNSNGKIELDLCQE